MSILYYLGRDAKVYAVCTLLTIWCLTSTGMLMMRKEKIVLLQMNGFDTRIVGAAKNPPVEIENYIHNFVGLFYSYTSQNYEDHMNRAAPLFEVRHFKNRWRRKVNSMFDTVEATRTVQNSFVESIIRIDDLYYELALKVERKTGETENRDDYKVRIRLEKSDRTVDNPYGIKITSLEEIYG